MFLFCSSSCPQLYDWYHRKLPLLAITRSGGRDAGLRIVDLIFFCTKMHFE